MDVKTIVSSVDNYDQLVEWIEKLNASKNSNAYFENSSSLVKAFGQLAKQGALSKKTEKKDAKVSKWLSQQLQDLFDVNLNHIAKYPTVSVSVASKILLIQGKYQGVDIQEQVSRLISASSSSSEAVDELQPVMAQYDDLRFYLLESIPSQKDVKNLIPLLCSLEKVIGGDENLNKFYAGPSSPVKGKDGAKKYREAFQRAWVHILSQPSITASDLKAILTVMHARIIPNMLKPQLLMDFLLDAYDHGGAISMLSLNALFSLIQYHHLEFPNFFTKLYELLEDGSILVSSHRARFLRLVDLFLTSTHLPATIPASIIKRLARLCLFAPPGAIVAVIPFVYNQLKRHPTCMVMIHRVNAPLVDGPDPFDNDEKDPLLTHAIDSSLWELQSLTSHYHPNVAAIAKIFSQPFRKPSYQLDHFLSHSYETLYATEHHRKRDKEPGLEFENYNIFDDLSDAWTI